MSISGDRNFELSEVMDSASSEYSYSSSLHGGSAKPTRRPYKRAAVHVRITSEYTDKRSRNNTAVQKFRSRSKGSLKAMEEDISTYASLTHMFKDESCRIEESTKVLQDLLEKHYHGVSVADEIQRVIRSEAQRRDCFTKAVDTLEASLNDTVSGSHRKPQ